MPAISNRDIKRRVELNGAQETAQHLLRFIESKDLKPEDFSLRGLAESFIGREWVDALDPRDVGGFVPLTESTPAAVNVGAFSSITGQIVYSKILDAYMADEFIFSRMIPTVPTRLAGERIAGIGEIGDKADKVGEGQPYPSVGLNENYIDTPVTEKRGLKVPVSKEAIFFDRTGLVLNRAADVGNWLGLKKEKRLIDMVIGVTNNHRWKGTAYNTYQATTPWVNIKTGQTLVDWNNVDAAEQTLYAIKDLNTNEPIMVTAKHIACNRAYGRAAERVVGASMIRVVAPGYATSGNPNTTEITNPYAGKYAVLYSQQFNARQTAASQDARYWYLGDFTKAFAYMENWPITVLQAPANHPDEFDRDIVVQFRASEMGIEAVLDPRYVVQVQN